MQSKVLRCYKNRFGPTYEIGVFGMGPDGLSSLSVAAANTPGDTTGASTHWEEATGLARVCGPPLALPCWPYPTPLAD
jgi:hypothetical protein